MLIHYLVSHLYSVVTAIVATVMVLRLVSSHRTPQSLLAWILAMVFLPLAAIPLYFLIGTRKFPRTAKRKMRPPAPRAEDLERTPVARVLHAVGAPPVRDGNRFELLENGERAYERLLELIGRARHSITLNVFILADDATGWSVVEALAARAREGVRVRVVVDAVGSSKIKRRAGRVLANAGGELRSFMPLLDAPLRGRTNLRDHRKLAVFDGTHVFLGGMNIAEEYMGPIPRPGRWRDVAAVVSGPVAFDAEALFESDWAFCGGSMQAADLPAPVPQALSGHATGQLVPSGPDMEHDTFYNALLTAISVASEQITIVTAYYVPDEVVQRALILAARRGVQTRLVMPSRSNHALADFARRGLLRGLAAAGVELHFYPHGMVHAKAMVVDNSFACLGSPNIDMRSFFLNYEDAFCLYSAPHVAQVRRWADSLLAECTTRPPHSRREYFLFELVARILAPEL